ncbi:hypothetical protein D3C78_1442760 [compost metagenome]
MCKAEPWMKGSMAFSTPSGLMCTSSSRPRRSAVWSRKAIISRNFQVVSTCSRGKGGLPGAKAFIARCSMTALSLPME